MPHSDDILDKKDKKKLITTIRDRYQVMVEADRENRQLGIDDMKFVNVPGAQWDDNMKQERGNRPCYEYNKLRVTAKRIINEMRANRPQGKIRGVEGGDKSNAEIMEGLSRNIWNTSDGDSVLDYEAEYQVSAGMGAWRVTTDYVADDAFDQDIQIEALPNPFNLWWDPSAKDMTKRDAMDCIYTEKISKKEFDRRWPKAEPIDFEDTEFDDEDEWESDETVRIAEYWYKVPYKHEIWQLEDGKVVSADSDEAELIDPSQIKNKRISQSHKVMMCIASGRAILEEPVEWAGKELPFVVVYGEYMIIDGKVTWFGIARFAKDAQRSYNFSRTAISETIAQAPQAKWWATDIQAAGHVDKWSEAHRKNFPFMTFTPDPKSPGPPIRMGGADVPVALIQESAIASDEIKAVTGIFSPDVGAGDNAKSGVQERERRTQGQIATFNYQDNMAKAQQRTYEILIDLIPKVFDTERELRVLGTDDVEDYIKINTFVQSPETGEPIKINDLSMGRYDVVVTSGPSFATKREEAAEIYSNLAQGNPAIFGVAGDLIMKAMDLPYSEDISERLQAMLPPEIQQTLNKDGGQSPEVQAAMQQANMAMQQVEMQMQQVQQAAQQVQQEQAQADKSKSEAEKANAQVQTAIANLKTEEAKFEAKIAQQIAKVTQKDSQSIVVQTKAEQAVREIEHQKAVEGDESAMAQQMQQAIIAIQGLAQEFTGQAVNALSEIQQVKDEKPKIVRMESKRENGKLVAIPIYEDRTSPAG